METDDDDDDYYDDDVVYFWRTSEISCCLVAHIWYLNVYGFKVFIIVEGVVGVGSPVMTIESGATYEEVSNHCGKKYHFQDMIFFTSFSSHDP